MKGEIDNSYVKRWIVLINTSDTYDLCITQMFYISLNTIYN